MTEEERGSEGAEETIEDLEAPAASQAGVAGGVKGCIEPSCYDPDTRVALLCAPPTCKVTKSGCSFDTSAIVVHEV
jgi:hypothetical protein